jgi:hypothetical protein
MDELLKVPMEIAVMLAGGATGAMALLKKIVKGNGKEIPKSYKVPMVGALAFLGSLLWFNSTGNLEAGNWLNILAVTALATFLSVIWHNAQKGGRRN